MRLKLHIWRQKGPNQSGAIKTYDVTANEHMSFLEMLDVLNQELIGKGEEPVAFDHDCREGICGSCNLVINGVPHGPQRGTTACQLHMRTFKDGDEIWIEPWRAKAFPVIKDLVVDRGAFDRIIAAGGYVSVNTGSAPDANEILIGKADAEEAFGYAACIGCGACVAACKNASAMLFTAAKFAHLQKLPQGRVEADRRAVRMVQQHDAEGFGSCTNQYECEAVCPKEISVTSIARLNAAYRRASLRSVEV
ncbi:MAG: succinate dehydrogenase/fumarate reductase iron-sulfur subunit [Planctomycetes bacterium]|nr:succinate dehydrogenase/fumarate reductase iron-sulfur subunit [Planctomycetota bacterium]